ncbi:signal recognition particle subunit FFH/SRP54 (srp54) [Dethiosulfatibacter aminovorans DSM 17477]|uniref:Signal recognition particle protein n=1 Tax=Dethiosulfatibacter aminovorans DSM 17477 TaxID=1121476 RepID=A0A1M6DGI1_9FIRM|nr:signal recognition particle protein [Dethiosulfatibacter aminovorans]SHI72223.1 signal recognition particle subunit FFH/SRP54 (srp54) [Dethiosulfatibacter aminovorans DSM 17477]
MIFESLSDKIQGTLNKLKGKGKLTEKDINNAMREIKLSLLEADVNFKVVKDFIKTVKERSLGSEVMESLTPGQQVVKIVNEEMIKLLGESESKIDFSDDITVIMMCGLQGAGKTTTSGKLALKFKKQNKRPLIAACDIYRPAAIKQLEVVGKGIDVPVFKIEGENDAVKIANEAFKEAKKKGNDVLILDTAGRLHIDEALMEELQQIKSSLNPREILLVLDSMTGQDAVKIAEAFNSTMEISGVILTKVDGDARGGAALSLRAVTSKPIKFVTTGEKMSDLEPFYPDRMASRILGMGDVLSLIEKAQESFDMKQAKEMEQRLKSMQFTFDDFLMQMEQMQNLGPLDQLLEMIPGANSKQLKNIKIDEKELVYIKAIIQSMTKKERNDPSIINGNRRKRIAAGSGTSVQRVNRLLKQFNETKKMMKKMGAMEKTMKKRGGFKMPF